MFSFDKQYKLVNLLEALNLDDYADDNIENAPEINSQSSGVIQDTDQFDIFLSKRILGNDDSPLKPLEETVISRVNNDTTGKYTGRLMVMDTIQLILVLQKAVKYFGWEGNYNWIDTSKVDVFLKLFKKDFGTNVDKFNGDI